MAYLSRKGINTKFILDIVISYFEWTLSRTHWFEKAYKGHKNYLFQRKRLLTCWQLRILSSTDLNVEKENLIGFIKILDHSIHLMCPGPSLER